MLDPVIPRPAPTGAPELEDTLSAVESRLAALGTALRARDATAIDLEATELHRALARAVDRFALAARHGALPPALRHRLVTASGRVAAERESLARATAALDRAIDVLMPRDAATLYSAQGSAERSRTGGVIQA
jgi:hypothetical protein